MKIQRSKRFSAEVSTASLNDIMFFLLLFFLIISTLANPNVIKIMLPKASSTQTVNKQPITLSITADRNYYLNKDAVLWDELEGRLTTYSQTTQDPTVILRLASNLNVQDMVDVMSLCTKLKLKMVLATEKVSPQ